MTQSIETVERVRRYFSQQAEVYGREFYVELPKPKLDATTLDEFYHQIKDCQKCRLAKSRTNFVFGTGNPNAKLMCVGEGPGYDEDQQGEPFVGAAGQLLNKILAAIGFARDEVYIANIVKCRPPGNRNPESDEMEKCMPYLQRQIELIQPKLILALGRVAAQGLLGVDAAIGDLRGKPHKMGDLTVMVTYHPAALLRNSHWKRSTWDDVQKLRTLYDQIVGDKPPIS